MCPRKTSRRILSAAAVLLVASCGSDDGGSDDQALPDPTEPTGSATVDTTATTSTLDTSGGTTSSSAEGAATVLVDDACTLVPTADVVAALGVPVDDGVAGGDERRRVCTFQGTDIGVTVGVEGGARFDEKADVSRTALGVDGEELDGLGDHALFFFSDEDIAEGVGGTLVAVDDLTIDVTLQGMQEPALRDASVGIATLAVSNL